MGASFNCIAEIGTETEIRAKFAQIQDQDRYENGHVYSGGFGMAEGLTFTNKTFATNKEARDWLLDNCQKWDNALAAKVGDHWVIGAWCAS